MDLSPSPQNPDDVFTYVTRTIGSETLIQVTELGGSREMWCDCRFTPGCLRTILMHPMHPSCLCSKKDPKREKA